MVLDKALFLLVAGVGGRGRVWEGLGGNFWVCRIAVRTGIKISLQLDGLEAEP